MRKNNRNVKEYTSTSYAMTANKLIVTLGAPKGEVNSDICVIGGGFTGLSAALELAQKGYSVTLLEVSTVASSASGKNGGHLQRGFGESTEDLIKKFGTDTARMMCTLSLEGLALILTRIKEHEITCDLKFGHLSAALDKRHIKALTSDLKAWSKLGFADMQMVDKAEARALVRTEKYIGGLFDPKGAHFHPLNYALGLTVACQKLGVKIYENTKALRIQHGDTAKVITEHGAINAKFVFVAGAIDIPEMKMPLRRSISASAHVIATEPIGERRAREIMPKDIAVIDARFLMNYYRFTADHRMVFGGTCNYTARDFGDEDDKLRKRMIDLFPALKMTTVEHCWHGPLDLTINRLPDIGKLAPNVFYAHGFGGHGVISTNILGKVIAEAISGTAERFDVFEKIRHAPFLGGDLLKRPLFVLGMSWYKLRDLIY